MAKEILIQCCYCGEVLDEKKSIKFIQNYKVYQWSCFKCKEKMIKIHKDAQGGFFEIT